VSGGAAAACRIVMATAADDESVAMLIRELAAGSAGTSTVDAAYVRRYLDFPGRAEVFADVAGERVGIIAYSANPNMYHANDGCLIEDLYVRPGHRGKGIGRALVAHVMAEAGRREWAEVSVSTGTDNHAALALYRSMGLVEEYALLEKHFPGA
jgi:GNAT superfamily N-acetyltransferase